MKKHVLVIEDDREMALLIKYELEAEGYMVTQAHDSSEGLLKARQLNPDLVILDRRLPDNVDGIEICRRLRKNTQTPIIMMTSRSNVTERVAGLDAGANDYILKPFHIEEFLARVRVQLRTPVASSEPISELVYGDLRVDLFTRQAYRGEERILLSGKEFDLLLLFMRHPQEVLSKTRILNSIWRWDNPTEENIVEVYMHHLRKKVHLPNLPKLLYTIRGVGYTLKQETVR